MLPLAHSGSTGGIHFELLSISVAVLVLTLKPGDHTVAVEFVGDDHRSFEPKVLERIEVTAR